MNDQFLTTREFAERLSVSKRTVFRWVKARKIAPVRLDGGFRFRLSAVEQFIQRRHG